MGVLNRLFGSLEELAEKIALDDKSLWKQWNEYLATVSRKTVLVAKLRNDSSLKTDLKKLQELLDVELVDAGLDEKETSTIIADIQALENSSKIQRVHKLEQCLGYAETRFEFVHGLLRELHAVLVAQMSTVSQLLSGKENVDVLLSRLDVQVDIESVIVGKIGGIKTFHSLFLNLVKGEHVIKTMDSSQNRLLAKMKTGMSQIFSGELQSGVTSEWALEVLNGIEDKVHESVAMGVIEGYHSNVDFQYANSPAFVDLVRECAQRVRKSSRLVSERMIVVFVNLFREWYNHERE